MYSSKRGRKDTVVNEPPPYALWPEAPVRQVEEALLSHSIRIKQVCMGAGQLVFTPQIFGHCSRLTNRVGLHAADTSDGARSDWLVEG